MTPSFSIYLEFLRIIATLLVFISHGAIFYEPWEQINETSKLGRDGVIIFFLLSGYIISWAATEKERCISKYIINRSSRIYSVAIPGIFLGVIASIVTSFIESTSLNYQLNNPLIYLSMHLTFTGNFWFLSETPPKNFPYWSLNYEVWYYIIFSAFFFIKGKLRYPLVIFLIVIVGPDLLLLFPLWIAGSIYYFNQNKIHIPQKLARICFVSSIIILLSLKIFQIDDYIDQYNALVLFFLKGTIFFPTQFLGDYLLTIVVLSNMIFFHQSNFFFSPLFTNIARKVAAYSFSFYLFHIPIFSMFRIFYKNNTSFLLYLVILFITSIIIVFLAKYTEHKKPVFRKVFQYVIEKSQKVCNTVITKYI